MQTFSGILMDAKLERSVVIQGFMKAFHDIEKAGRGFGKVPRCRCKNRLSSVQCVTLCISSHIVDLMAGLLGIKMEIQNF